MAEQALIQAFDDCIDRLNRGESLESCLHSYPDFADTLRPMLETGRGVRQLEASPFEVQAAQAAGRARVLQAMADTQFGRRDALLAPYMRLVAAIALLMLVFLSGASLAAESSLPGDPLYGLKRLTENLRSVGGFSFDFDQRRIDEIRQLQALQRAAQVTFSGDVEEIQVAVWRVAGLSLDLRPETVVQAGIKVSDRVQVRAETHNDGRLVAQQILLIEAGDVLPTPTNTMQPSPTATVSATPSLTPSATPSPSRTATTTRTPQPSATATSAECLPAAPAGWVQYRVRAGDTLSGLAAQTGVTISQLIAVNCLPDSGLLVLGQQIFLAFAPATPLQPTVAQGSSGTGGQDNRGASGSGSSDDNSDDEREDEDERDDDNSGPGENSGPGGGGSGSNSGPGGGGDDDDDD